MANWFIGLTIDPGDWFARIPPPPAGVRMFHPEDLHVTVAFLGSVNEERARRAFERAQEFPAGSIGVTLGRVVPMGRPTRPSALSALLGEGAARVAAGILVVRDAMADAAQVAREQRAVRPHVTLARPRRDAKPRERTAALDWAAALDLRQPWVEVTSLGLYTWAGSPSPRRFQVVQARFL
jgi:2'-5' RNA ligase